MLYLTIALFAISAVFGLTILIRWLTKKDAPRGVIYSHGIFAAVALVLLVVYALQNPTHYPQISLYLFILVAIVGFYMFFRDLMKKQSPMFVAIIHALVAIGAFLGLLFFTFA